MSKILLVTSDFAPRLGGVSKYYSQIVNNYSDFKVLTNVQGARGDNVYKTSWTWSGWPKWLPLLWIVPFWKYKTNSSISAAGEILPVGTALMIMRYCFGWPYIVFLHGLDIQLAKSTAWKKWLSKKILTKSELIIVNSNFTKKLVLDLKISPKSVAVVYPVVSSASVNKYTVEELITKYKLSGKRIILTVARLVKRKGIDDVMQALAAIKDEIGNFIYVVVGEGSLKDDLLNEARQHNIPVLFPGSINDSDLAAWYEICDLFVLTPKQDKTDVEGFGIVYLEAQSHSKPVIGTNVGGVPEAVGDAGVILNSSLEISSAIKKVLLDENFKKLLTVKSSDHVKLFNSSHQVQQLTQALTSMETKYTKS